MIGQKKLLSRIDQMAAAGFPRFTILVGPAGGRGLVAAYIAKALDAQYAAVGIKVDEIREAISLSYRQSTPTLYVIPAADRMSAAAKNALLKVTEEPPRKAYFIMILADAASTLATLRSRGTVLSMDAYLPDELLEYAAHKKYELDEEEAHIICNVCTTPSDVDMLVRYEPKTFYSFAEKVMDNIGTVNGANAFKIANSFSFKEDDGKWEPVLFLRVIMHLCRQHVEENPALYVEVCKVTSAYIAEFNINGLSKAATVDMWILDVRKAWRQYDEERN
jgi:hypothetical protein